MHAKIERFSSIFSPSKVALSTWNHQSIKVIVAKVIALGVHIATFRRISMTDINSRQPEACARRAAPSPRDSRAAPVLPLTTCATRRGERREGGRRPIRSAVSPHLGPRISPFSFLLVVLIPLAKQTRRASSMPCMSSYSPCAPTQCSNPVVWFRLLREDNLSNLPLSLLLRRPITCSPLHIHTTGVRVCDHKFTDCTRRMRWGKASEPPR